MVRGSVDRPVERCLVGAEVPYGELNYRWSQPSYRVVSIKVTLLISFIFFSVVAPAFTLASADWRRKCVPFSRAAFRILELGCFSRIISRMRSVNSSSSWTAVQIKCNSC